MNEIRNNNIKINSQIKQILSLCGNRTISSKDGKFYLNQPYSEILEMEIKKVLLTYELEYNKFCNETKHEALMNTMPEVEDDDNLDAHGYGGSILLSSGSDNVINQIKSNENSRRYTIDNEGRIRFDKNGGTEKIECSIIGDTDFPHFISSSEYIENDLDIQDYMVLCYLQDYKSIDFFLDAIPHEAMHVFGFKNEGITENFTRQVAKKYGIRALPIAHASETRLIQQLQKIIGRDILENAYYTIEDEGKYIVYDKQAQNKIYELIDKKLDFKGNDIGLYKRLEDLEKEEFEEHKLLKDLEEKHAEEEQRKKVRDTLKDIKRQIVESRKRLSTLCENYIKNNPKKIYSLEGENENQKLTSNQQEKKEEIQNFQQYEIKRLEEIIKNLERNNFDNSLSGGVKTSTTILYDNPKKDNKISEDIVI